MVTQFWGRRWREAQRTIVGCRRGHLALSSYQDQVGGSFSKPGLQQSLCHVQQLAKELGRNTG